MWNPLYEDVSKERHERLLREAEHYRIARSAQQQCGSDTNGFRSNKRDGGWWASIQRWLSGAFRSRRAVDPDLTEEFPQMIDLGANGC